MVLHTTLWNHWIAHLRIAIFPIKVHRHRCLRSQWIPLGRKTLGNRSGFHKLEVVARETREVVEAEIGEVEIDMPVARGLRWVGRNGGISSSILSCIPQLTNEAKPKVIDGHAMKLHKQSVENLMTRKPRSRSM